MKDEQKLCLKAQGFREYVKAHDIDVINAVKNKLDAYKVGRYEGFLAGLKAGRPQWHDLRKDPNDLPKEQKEYWCKINYYESDEVFNGCLTYNPKLKGFDLDTDENLFDVAAWCEIPTFDKE